MSTTEFDRCSSCGGRYSLATLRTMHTDECAFGQQPHEKIRPKLAAVENLVPDNGRTEIAVTLRELADLCEKGEVVDLVVAYDHRGDKCYTVNGFYQDKWRMLGAIEYLKTYVFPVRE